MKRKRVVLFGTGNVYCTFMQVYNKDKIEIVGLSDNDSSKWNTKIDGIDVFEPNKIINIDPDMIIVTTVYDTEIREQLMKLGIENEKIQLFSTIYKRLPIFNNGLWSDILREDYVSSIIIQHNSEQMLHELIELQRKSLFLQSRQLSNTLPKDRIGTLQEVEFQVYSQFGEDGIIQWLIKNATIPNKVFVEFGVGDYSEANTRFLLMNNNWSGLIIDGSKDNIERIKMWEQFWKYDLTAVDSFITKDNINEIILNEGFEGDIGILSVDIDGNDYWVLNAIECVNPRILICEYNNIFGSHEKVSIPYNECFYRTESHYSNLYWGASLGAFLDYAARKGYYYFGSNSAGNNAFFVRKDCIDEQLLPTNNMVFVQSKYRESRNESGEFTYLRGNKQLEEIKDMPLVDIETGVVKKISDIYHI